MFAIFDTVNRFYANMDDKFYKDLGGKPDNMNQLVGYLNEFWR